MISAIRGKILVIDNEYDATVEKAITTLIQKNLCVQYWNGAGELPKSIKNVRIVILDLDLAGVGIRSPGLLHYQLSAEALSKIPGPYLVIIMARDFMKEDPVNLAEAYRETFGKPVCGIISRMGLTKSEEIEDPKAIQHIIQAEITVQTMLEMAFLWEEVIDRAKDIALNDLIPERVDSTISTIIKILCKEMGDEAASRELVDLVMQLISRRVTEGQEFEKLKKLVKVINEKKIRCVPGEPDLKAEIHNRIMFYKPKKEGPWTGDIYKVKGGDKYSKYAIILNSPCDLAQKKTWSFRICFGFSIEREKFENRDYPPYKIDPFIAEKVKSLELKKTIAEEQKKLEPNRTENIDASIKNEEALLIRKACEHYTEGGLYESLYVLHNVKENNSFLQICFDFNNMKTIEKDKLIKCKRICRLDSPFLEELLQRYGNHAFRIGTMPINKPA